MRAPDTPPPAAAPPLEGETLDRLAGDWWIYQLARGHRYATDDLLVAWTALCAVPGAGRFLDLGSGVGSVGLLCLVALPETAELTAIERQDVSAGLCRRTLGLNGLERRVRLLHGDLRDPALLAAGTFDVVTANPPFLPMHAATASPVPQRAAARLELNGDVFDYAAAAVRCAPGAVFVFCHDARDERPRAALRSAIAGRRIKAIRTVCR